MKPFADDKASLSIGGFTIENGEDRLACYGDFEITRDKAGLALAEKFMAAFAGIQAELVAMDAKGELPEKMPPNVEPEAVTKTPNPFE